LVPLTGSAQEQHDLTVNFCEVDANDLAKIEFVQATTQILSITKMIIVRNASKSSLHRSAKRAVQAIKPVKKRNPPFAGFIHLNSHF